MNYSTQGYIYKIHFIGMEDKYVGSTYNNPEDRYKEHLRLLKKQTHHNYKLQNLYNKYKDLMRVEIIETLKINNRKDLFDVEQKYLDKGEYNLNISMKAEGTDPELLKKKILQYSKDGKFIKEWDSATDASKILNIEQTSIRNNIYGINKSAGGYQWRFFEQDFPVKIDKVTYTKPKPPINKTPVNVYDLHGNLIKRCESYQECVDFTDIGYTHIKNVKNTKPYKNYFICSPDFLDKEFEVLPIKRTGKYDLEGNLIKVYGYASEAMKEIGKHVNYVYMNLSGRQKTCFGFVYRNIQGEIIKKIQL